MKPEPDCKVCSDTGWKVVPDPRNPNREAIAHCDQCHFWARKRGEAPGVPKDEQGSRIENFVTTEPVTAGPPEKRHAGTVDALRHANYWLQGVHPDLYLYGPCGTGKTRLACSLLNAKWVAGERVRFVSCPDLLMQLQPRDDGAGGELFDQVTSVPILALDDVGAQQGTDFARRQLQIIYDRRLAQRLRTIWTSNLDLDELAVFLNDDRLTSRIAGKAKVVQMGCRDWRLRQQRQRETSKG